MRPRKTLVVCDNLLINELGHVVGVRDAEAKLFDLRKEAREGLMEYWERHPEAYLKFRREQIASCLDKDGKIIKKHRKAHNYYVDQIFIFELLQSLKPGGNFFDKVMGEKHAVHQNRLGKI
jgi:hypothetical protein